MIEAVFISDLHLHPENKDIEARFIQFIEWAKRSVKNIYILGDFFHVWAGDDAIDEWSTKIAQQLSSLKKQGINLFYMHGNRDFLLGKTFAKLAEWTILNEPTIIHLNGKIVLLAHGDRYCTKDITHQRFRLLTRNYIFSALFLKLPLKFRNILVNKVRYQSQINQKKTKEEMDVVLESVTKHMLEHKATELIHGHTHKPGSTTYRNYPYELTRYVLSDWDDKPNLLCYDDAKGFYFIHI